MLDYYFCVWFRNVSCAMFRVIFRSVGFHLVLGECGQLVVHYNDDISQVIKLPGVTNVSGLVFEDPCAF